MFEQFEVEIEFYSETPDPIDMFPISDWHSILIWSC